MIWRHGETVAGHDFFPSGTCKCGRRWLDIRNATSADVDAAGIAHTGKLTTHEAEQIRQLREREDAAIAAAMNGVSGRRAETAALPEDWTLFWSRQLSRHGQIAQEYMVKMVLDLVERSARKNDPGRS